MPCLNEAETLASCIREARGALERYRLDGEIVVADNGSSDGSQEIAQSLDARVIPVSVKGYGAALQAGITAAGGEYVVMADADASYDFSRINDYVERLDAGYDLVMGNRFLGGIEPGAMPVLHRYLGNPVLSGLGRLFFRARCGDFHCGMRGFRRDAVVALDLRSTGMEYASEMIVKATLRGLRLSEIPTPLRRDGRSREPHLRTWRDGWRHLRFLLLYSPRWLFLLPGLLLSALGLVGTIALLAGPRTVAGIRVDVNSLLYSICALLLGTQAVALAVFAKTFVISNGLLPEDPKVSRLLTYATPERGILLGVILLLAVGDWDVHRRGVVIGALRRPFSRDSASGHSRPGHAVSWSAAVSRQLFPSASPIAEAMKLRRGKGPACHGAGARTA